MSNDTGMVRIETHAKSWLVEEHLVDLLECPARRLHTKKVCQWDEGCAHDGPDPEVVASNVGQTDGGDHDDDEV